jgi:SAM-dependent methyltransferase
MASARCAGCDYLMRCQDSIWRALPEDRAKYFQQFVNDYETVRRAEGRGSSDASYYLALPFRDLSRRLAWQWRIRAQSYRTLESRILPIIEGERIRGMHVLDIGAGNGWLCYRTALRGHHPVAVDLLLNNWDGLGATRHYLAALPHSFPLFQGEMDHLPFGDAQFDMVIFNASLHYSTDYLVTLTEALRCLKLDGHLLIMDSPVYQREENGLAMRAERHQQFAQQYGFRSDSIPSREFLTFATLEELSQDLKLAWRFVSPWYGIAWALRPLKARLLRKREPSRFVILWGRRTAAS